SNLVNENTPHSELVQPSNIKDETRNGELFLKIDDDVQCFNENENYDNILDEIAERSLQNEESDENDDVQPVKITTREAEKNKLNTIDDKSTPKNVCLLMADSNDEDEFPVNSITPDGPVTV
ncbi:Hypothetical protein CINCED_3A008787, partial [Cinara cedri]